ncbi:Pisatin demethylase [Cytospora mali]|uniref:Pisatin demethylase n=1 Tax=Cytospora mali TaxID=578113 RepID=A0A194WCL2_CYTMA|nr:Pisatin demethylase [Valsa mali]
MGHWFQCYAFDVIACITYGTRFGFLDDGHDIQGIMGDLYAVLRYSTLVGIYSWLHDWIFHPAAKLQLFGARGRVTIMKFVEGQMAIRREERKERDVEDKVKCQGKAAPIHFLDRLLDQNQEDPEKTTMYHVFLVCLANINAGSDTTATSLSGMLYHLLRLKHEIRGLSSRSQLSEQPSFKEIQQMPYFDAVMKESLRLHSAVGLPLWRVVPEGGTTVAGQYLPQGTNVGVNAWVAHLNEDVWGPDARGFRPERWCEAQAEALKGNKDRLRQMEAYYLPFGLGSRTCIGRHISILEMSKLMPRLLRDFEFELERPDEKWKCENFWFVIPKDFSIRVRRASRTA